MKKYTSIILSTIIICCCCSNRNNEERKQKFSNEEILSLALDSTQNLNVINDYVETIDLKPLLKESQFDFGDMIKSIKFIPLETNDESLISNIEHIIITENNIYIGNDNIGRNILIFNRQGEYINQIKHGQGPNEILRLKSIAYDDDQEELIVYHTKFLSFFTKDGKFKRKEKVPLNACSFTLVKDGYMFYAENGIDNRHLGYADNYQVLITDRSFRLRTKGFPYLLSGNLNYGGKYIHKNERNINITFVFIDSIYQYLDNNTFKAKYRFDISNKKIPVNILKNATDMEFRTTVENHNYYYFLGKFEETESHLFVAFSNDFTKTRINFFVDKMTKNIKGGTGQLYKISDFPGISLPIAAKGNYFISYIQPYEIIPSLEFLNNPSIEEDIVKLKKLKDDDNPVLILYELKSF
jgi:hypothetical protein